MFSHKTNYYTKLIYEFYIYFILNKDFPYPWIWMYTNPDYSLQLIPNEAVKPILLVLDLFEAYPKITSLRVAQNTADYLAY